jgi:acyl-coenzyme A thioesterase PaaI-like protein
MSDYNSTPLKASREVKTPAGWDLAEQFDPFEASLGPYFQRMHNGVREFAFILDDRHINAQNVAHGGALLTFADAALGYAIWEATDRSPCVRKAREVIFMRADFKAGDRIVFTASAIWRIWPKQ